MCEAPCVRDASVAYAKISSSRIVSSLRISEKTARAWRTAFITLPVPALPLRRIIAAPSAMRRSASPRSCAPHTNGMAKGRLSMWFFSSAAVRTCEGREDVNKSE